TVPGSKYTDMEWEVCPEAFGRLLTRIKHDYRGVPPIYITENGAAFPDAIAADGKIHDADRTEYLKDHLIETRKAMDAGVDVKGYFVWSLMDNFEWAHGYSKRFGIVHVDFDTQKRIIKDSGHWYAKLAQELSIHA